MERTLSTPLFPAALGTVVKEETKPALFPAYSTGQSGCHSQTSSEKGPANADWLSNKSYTSETAEKLKEFQREIEDTLKRQNEKSISPEIEGSSRSQDSYDCTSQKREHSRDHSSSDDEDEAGDSKKRHKREKREKKKHKKHKKKQKKHEKHREDITDAKPITASVDLFSANKIFIDEFTDLHPSDAYRLDRKADLNSWTYGSLYSKHIARYRRVSNSCIGLPMGVKIYMSDHKKSTKEKQKDLRYFSKEIRKLVKSQPVQVVRPDQSLKVSDQQEHYLPLSQIRCSDKQTANVDVRQQLLDESTQHYIQGKGAEIENDKDNGAVQADPWSTKTADYNRRLRETPDDVELWLEFIKFQDKLHSDSSLLHDTDEKQDKRKSKSLVLLERKVSIVEKALQANPGSIKLQLYQLDLCREMWEPSKINKELEKLLFVHPASTKVWRFYLKFNQSTLSMFTVSKVTKLYQKCFKTLVNVSSGKVQTARVPDDLQADIVEIFVEYCHFLKSAGHTEKALASMQSLLELNLFCPPELESYSPDDKVSVFEGFWDSGVARVGEPGAKGWKSWVESKGSLEADAVPIDREILDEREDEIVEQNLPKQQAWLKIEQLRNLHHWLPWRPDMTKDETEEDCEDLDRLVLFDDISPALFILQPSQYFRCVLGYLSILGVNLENSKLAVNLLCSENKVQGIDMYMYVKLREVLVQDFDQFACLDKPEMSETVRSFVVNLLTSMIKHFSDAEQTCLTLLLLEFRLSDYFYDTKELAKSEVKEVKKFVKNLLKESQNRNNLAVWAAYINLERRVGKAKEVEGILETALTLFSKQSAGQAEDISPGMLALYRIYSEVLLGIKPVSPSVLWDRRMLPSETITQEVVQILNCSFNKKTFQKGKLENVSGTTLLKCRSKVRSLFDSLGSQIAVPQTNGSCILRAQYLEVCQCYALFEFCTSGMSAAIIVYRKAASNIKTFKSTLADLEQAVYTAELRLVLYHMSTQSVPLPMLRTSLDKAIERFPNNPVFLNLFVDIERRSRIAGRLHRTFERLTRDTSSPNPVMVAVNCEMNFHKHLKEISGAAELGDVGIPERGIVHRTRALLDRSLDSLSLRHCPLVWRIYLQVESQFGSQDRMKGVFYRALQHCPSHKALYMDGVQLFGEGDLQEIVDLMTEKEIRVQMPVEELDLLLNNK